MKRTVLLIVSVLTLGLFLWPAPEPVSHDYFDRAPKDRAEIIAHGGGLGHAPPNTIFALRRALEMGADVLEVDVQQTKDGVLILRHDDTLNRTTDMEGPIAQKTWNEVSGADAGARSVIDGVSYAGRGLTVPRLDAALAEFETTRWILEIKNDTEVAALAMCEAIQAAGAERRVLVGSFHDRAISHFRNACPDVATSMASGEVRRFVIAARLGLSRFLATPAAALQLPPTADGIDLAHPRIIYAAHARGFRVQYWTINDENEMLELLALGADGLITDYVDRGRKAAFEQKP